MVPSSARPAVPQSTTGPAGARPAVPPPVETVALDARTLRALAHPLRLRLLGLLRLDGPATATGLAARTGQSSGATSYHLRQLAAAGLVAELPDRGNARERWWQAMHRTTTFDLDDADGEVQVLGEEYLHAVVDAHAARGHAAVAALPTLDQDLGPGWRDGFTVSDTMFRVSHEQAVALVADLEALLERYPREPVDPADAAPGTHRVELHLAALPFPDLVRHAPRSADPT